jgi:hypothetical protein
MATFGNTIPTRLITEYDVARAANNIIKAAPAHFKYPHPVPVYLKDGKPSCIVACIVAELGIHYQNLIENVPPSRQPDLGVEFTPDAARMLDVMQQNQDDMLEWEDVVADTYVWSFGSREDYLKKL